MTDQELRDLGGVPCTCEPERCAAKWILLGQRCCARCSHRPTDAEDWEWHLPDELFVN